MIVLGTQRAPLSKGMASACTNQAGATFVLPSLRYLHQSIMESWVGLLAFLSVLTLVTGVLGTQHRIGRSSLRHFEAAFVRVFGVAFTKAAACCTHALTFMLVKNRIFGASTCDIALVVTMEYWIDFAAFTVARGHAFFALGFSSIFNALFNGEGFKGLDLRAAGTRLLKYNTHIGLHNRSVTLSAVSAARELRVALIIA